MNAYTPEEVAAARANSPRIIRDFLDSLEFKRVITEISTRFKLNLYNIAELTDAIAMIVLDLRPQNYLPTDVAQMRIHLDAEEQRALIAEIDKKIFKEIKDRLQRMPPTDA